MLIIGIVLVFVGVRASGYRPGFEDWAAWVQAIGSIIGIFIAIWVPYKQRQQGLAADEANRREDARRICMAIHDELTMLQKLFTEGPNVAALLRLQPGEIFNLTVPEVVPGERFSIYRAVVGRLTLIDDDQLRQDIIWAYETAIGLIHSGLQNNRMLFALSEMDEEARPERYQFQLEQLRVSAAGMQTICKQTVERVNALLPALGQAIGRV